MMPLHRAKIGEICFSTPEFMTLECVQQAWIILQELVYVRSLGAVLLAAISNRVCFIIIR